MEKIIHITFMRHGRSRADDEGVHEGRYDAGSSKNLYLDWIPNGSQGSFPDHFA